MCAFSSECIAKWVIAVDSAKYDDSLLLIDTNPHHELVFLVAAKIAWQTEKLKIKPFSPTGWNPDSKPGLH